MAALVENPDSALTSKRSVLASDQYKGRGTLYKETWPSSPEASFYRNLTPVPGVKNPKIVEDGGGDYSELFAAVYSESVACIAEGAACTVAKARQILDKYVDRGSFVGAMVMIAPQSCTIVLIARLCRSATRWWLIGTLCCM